MGAVNGCRHKFAAIGPSGDSPVPHALAPPFTTGVQCSRGAPAATLGPSSLATAPPLTTTQRHLASWSPSVRRRSFPLLFILSLVPSFCAPRCSCPSYSSRRNAWTPPTLHIDVAPASPFDRARDCKHTITRQTAHALDAQPAHNPRSSPQTHSHGAFESGQKGPHIGEAGFLRRRDHGCAS
jgi:hypothetical protein